MKRLLLPLLIVLLVAASVPQKGNAMTTPTLHNIVVNTNAGTPTYFKGVTVQEDRATRILRIFKDGEQIATYLPDTGWVEWHDYDANETAK